MHTKSMIFEAVFVMQNLMKSCENVIKMSLKHLEMSYINEIISSIKDQVSYEGIPIS